MAYQKTTVKEILEKINSRKIYLPAIQRKYVWVNKGDSDRICKLFDSILREYPIGTFLFWNVNGKIINEKEYSLYEFIKDYSLAPNGMHVNPRVKNALSPEVDYDVVLDGQQRMTSLYISLYGSLALKAPYRRKYNVYPVKELYFNLLSKESEERDCLYEFKFLTHDEAKYTGEERTDGYRYKWFKVKDILKYSKFEDVINQFLIPNNLIPQTVVFNNINKLWTILTTTEVINYFQVKNNNMDEVLDIFVRVNSGGMVLSKTDLLFSTMISYWEDVRDKVDTLIEKLNSKGEGFSFDSDFIMRTALYLIGLSINKLKVEAFTKNNVEKIRDNWDKIESSIEQAVDILVSIGFCRDNIESYLAIMPIVYACYNKKINKQNIDDVRKYYVAAQLKKIFGTASSDTLTKLRDAIKFLSEFCFDKLKNIKFTNGAKMAFDQSDVEDLFNYKKGEKYTFMILSLLYNGLKFSNQLFHQDHMHPRSSFDSLKPTATLTQATINEWIDKRDRLANLQLLEGRENESKNDKPLKEWLKNPDNKRQTKYLPESVSFVIDAFDTFYEKRKELLRRELETQLK